ncbi:MAG: AAA family ATPase [Myxococcota bacterium]
MRCASCKNDNPEQAKFCQACGSPFSGRCSGCGTSVPTSARFCHGCGRPTADSERRPADYTPKYLAARILTQKSAIEGERKRVTVLFADIKGSQELAEDVDPEAWHRILDRFFAILSEGVHRFEGTINQFTGDGIMALFGAPLSLEDHATRACFASLHLQRELQRYADDLRIERGLNFSVRMGLNSGEVVVGKIGDDLRMDYTAQGATVGLAARMEQIAAPGKIYLTEHTARLVEGFFRLRNLGRSRIRGRAEPLSVFELESEGSLRTRLDASRARGFLRFVGREAELATLHSALERTLQGEGQVVGIVGEAGVGKSRLCLEFVDQLRIGGISIYEAHCLSHGRGVPFLPVLELLRSFFGIDERDSDETARQKIAGRLLLLDSSFEELLPLIFDFLSVPDPRRATPTTSPEARQRQLLGFIRQLVRDHSVSEPSVILVDDLHWVDAASDLFLAQLVDALHGARILFIANFRPEYRAEWMMQPHYQQLPLVPLGSREVDVLLAGLLGNDPAMADVSRRIRERSGGNPFFIEEIVYALVDSGRLEGTRGAYRLVQPLDELALPDTVQTLLAARIDRLPEREKHLLQTAAVIGRRFPQKVLQRVAELSEPDFAAALEGLSRLELIYEETLYPDVELRFKHPLTHDVAYGSQLAERRRATHESVAKVLAELGAEKLDERAALIGHHWESAGQALEAARWHTRAAGWAGYGDVAEAVRHWKKAFDLLAELPQPGEVGSLRLLACVQLLVMGSWRLGFTPKEDRDLFEQGERLAQQVGDPRTRVLVGGAIATRTGTTGDVTGFVARSEEVRRLAEETGDLDLRCFAEVGVGYARFCSGDLRESLAACQRVIEITGDDPSVGRELMGFSPAIWARMNGTGVLQCLGRLREAEDRGNEAIERARRCDDLVNLSFALGGRVFGLLYRGVSENASASARQALSIAEKHLTTFERSFALYTLGIAFVLEQHWEAAIEALTEALETGEQCRTGLETASGRLAILAEAQLGNGAITRALETAQRAVRVGQESGARVFELHGELAMVRVRLAMGDRDQADAISRSLENGFGLLDSTGARGLEPQLVEERGRLTQLLGDGAAARHELEAARRLYLEIGAEGRARQLARSC